jgi:hypothetical protein
VLVRTAIGCVTQAHVETALVACDDDTGAGNILRMLGNQNTVKEQTRMMTATSLANWSCGQGTAECGDLPGELVQYSVVSMHVTQHAARDKVYEITICRMGPLPPSAGIACACATCVSAR